jgi:transposase
MPVDRLCDVAGSLITTAKLNDVDPQAWLADILARVASHPVHRIEELMSWNWAERSAKLAA